MFALVVISATLAFRSHAGFIAVGLSTFLSLPFFEPDGSFTLGHALDLINIELYAIPGAGCVFAFSRLRKRLMALSDRASVLGLTQELGGDLELQSTTSGSSFHRTFPPWSPSSPTQARLH
jgi:hypothetical protein